MKELNGLIISSHLAHNYASLANCFQRTAIGPEKYRVEVDCKNKIVKEC